MDGDEREEDRLLAAWGVTREEIENLDPSYTQASADAKRELREMERGLIRRGQEIADDTTARLRAEGFEGVVEFKTEDIHAPKPKTSS